MLGNSIETLRSFLGPGGFWVAIGGAAGVVIFAGGRFMVTAIAKRKIKQAGVPIQTGEDPLAEPVKCLPVSYPGGSGFPEVPFHSLNAKWHSQLFNRWKLQSEKKTTKEYKELLIQYQELCNTYGELERTGNRQKLENLKLDADLELVDGDKDVRKKEQVVKLRELEIRLKELDLKAVEIERQMEGKEHVPSPQKPKTLEEEMRERFEKVLRGHGDKTESINRLKTILDEAIAKAPPELHDELRSNFRVFAERAGGK